MESIVIIILTFVALFLLVRLLGEMNKREELKKSNKDLSNNLIQNEIETRNIEEELKIVKDTLKKYQDGICNITIYRGTKDKSQDIFYASRVFVAIKRNEILGTEEKVSPFQKIKLEEQVEIAKEDTIELINNVDTNLGK